MNPSPGSSHLRDMLIIPTDRRCEYCHEPLVRGPKVGWKEWDRKRYCSNRCRGAAFVARNSDPNSRKAGRVLTVPESARRVATWGGIPQRCPHCQGLWRYLETSVCCRTCGRDLYVSAALPG